MHLSTSFRGTALVFAVLALQSCTFWERHSGYGPKTTEPDVAEKPRTLTREEIETVSRALFDTLIDSGSLLGIGGYRDINKSIACRGGGTASLVGRVEYSLQNLNTVQAKFDLTTRLANCAVSAAVKDVTVDSSGVRLAGMAELNVMLDGKIVVLDGTLDYGVDGAVAVLNPLMNIGCDVDYSQALQVWGPVRELKTSTQWKGKICEQELSGSFGV